MYTNKKRVYITETKDFKGRRKNIDVNKKLARVSSNNCIRLELAMSDNEEDKEKLKKTHGRKTYAEKAIELGMFEEITEGLIDFAIENPIFREKELMQFCIKSFPAVFGDYKSYPQNFYKIIEKVDDWFYPLKNAKSLGKDNIMKRLYKDAFIDDLKIKDRINIARLFVDLERLEYERDKEKVEDTDSSETKKTLVEIDRHSPSNEIDEDEDEEGDA